MQLIVQKIGTEYGLILPKQFLDQMALIEGSVVNLELASSQPQGATVATEIRRQKELLLQLEPLHADTYRELAKR